MGARLRAAAACVMLGLGSTLAACAASAPVQLYPGDPLPAARIASVTLPEQLEIVSINGAEVSGGSGPLRRGELTLHLAPGRYELLVFYRETWSVGDNDDVLRSDPAVFVVDAVAGGAYRIDFERPADYAAAQALRADFRGWTEDLRSADRVPSAASGLEFRRGVLATITGDAAVVRSAAAGERQAVMPLSQDGARHSGVQGDASLAEMQRLWQQATPQTRRAFGEWLRAQGDAAEP